MSNTLLPTFTTAGITAVFNATNTGLQAEISHIAIGDAAYTPDTGQTELQNERERIPVAGGARVDWNRIHVTALAQGNESYWVKEIGFFLDDGTLLAVWSDPDNVFAYKMTDVDLLLAFDLILTPLPPDSVTVTEVEAPLLLTMAEECARCATALVDGMRRDLQIRLMV